MKAFYVLRKHLKDCWYSKRSVELGGSVWVCPIVKAADPRRDKTKRRRGFGHEFLVYRCNDPKCSGELAIHLDRVSEVLKVNEGEPRTAGRRLR